MQPAQPLKLLVPKGLDTETETIDAGVSKRLQPLRGDGFRVGLERNLGVVRQRERLPARLDETLDFARLEQRRRSAAEIDRVGRRPVRS